MSLRFKPLFRSKSASISPAPHRAARLARASWLYGACATWFRELAAFSAKAIVKTLPRIHGKPGQVNSDDTDRRQELYRGCANIRGLDMREVADPSTCGARSRAK